MTDYTNINHLGAFAGADIYAKEKKRKKRDVYKILKKIPAYNLHRPARRNFLRRQYFVSRIGEQFGMDLADLGKHRSKNNLKQKYILAVLDMFSRKAWIESISNKTGTKVAAALEKILDRCGLTPKQILSDFGKEFYNRTVQKLLKKRGIKLISTTTGMKSAMVERFLRTIFGKIARYQTQNKTNRFVDKLKEFEILYNNSYNRSIGMKPIEVTKKTEQQVYDRLYGRIPPIYTKPKFKIKQQVFTKKAKGIFDKGYTSNYEEEPSIIIRVLETIPRTYLCEKNKAVDMYYENELIDGS